MTPAEQFREVIHKELGVAPAAIIGDGKTHRFSTTKNARDNAGEYRFFDDRFPAGFAKDYRRGIYFTWSARDDATVLSEPERAERAKIIRDREQRRQREQAEAARIAQQRWQKAKAAAPAHPYLTRKGVQAHGARQEGDALLVAVMDGDELISVQSIAPDGGKLFQLGSRKKGGFFTIGDAGDTIYLVEGFATGATIHELTGGQTIVCFDAGNLLAVAPKIRANYPEAHIVICGDDDFANDKNLGVAKATEAAKIINGYLAIPRFDRDKGETGTDFNDLHALHGSRAVHDALDAALDAGALKGEAASIYDEALPKEPPGFFYPVGAPLAANNPDERTSAIPPLKFICPNEYIGEEIADRAWIVPNWIPCGVVTGLYGDGGIGKSLLAQQLQTACAVGGEWAGQMVEPVKSLGFYCEDERDELLRRQARINRLYDCDKSSLENTRFVSRLGLDNILMTFDSRGRGETTQFHKQVIEASRDLGVRLVIFDTASDGFAGNENDRGQVRQFISRALGSVATAINGAVVLCAHPSRTGLNSGEGDGGSTAWSNTLRSRAYLAAPEPENGAAPDANARLLSRKKANYAARNDEVKLTWSDGVFIADSPSANIYRPAAQSVFLELLDDRSATGRSVSHNAKAPNFAPRDFAMHANRRGYRDGDFRGAMEQLFADKKIRVHEEGPPSRRRSWIVREPT